MRSDLVRYSGAWDEGHYVSLPFFRLTMPPSKGFMAGNKGLPSILFSVSWALDLHVLLPFLRDSVLLLERELEPN
jgi:hypothetical protein